MTKPASPFRCFNSSPEVIRLVVMMYVKINGEMHYLWRAVDHEGEVLESFATKDRDKAAALKFMKKLMKRHGTAKKITTDSLRSYASGNIDGVLTAHISPGLVGEAALRASTGL